MATNTYDHPNSRFDLLNELRKLNITDRKSQLMVANTFETVFDIPRLTVVSGVNCLSDWHCFEKG